MVKNLFEHFAILLQNYSFFVKCANSFFTFVLIGSFFVLIRTKIVLI